MGFIPIMLRSFGAPRKDSDSCNLTHLIISAIGQLSKIPYEGTVVDISTDELDKILYITFH